MKDRRHTILAIHRERRLEASRKRSFLSLIDSPVNALPSGLVLPEAANIGVSFSVNISAGNLTLTTQKGRALKTPALQSGIIHRIGFFDKGTNLIPSCTVSGTVSIYYLDDWRNPYLVATGAL
jgi:hypothetical protein